MIDPACSVAFEAEPAEGDVLNRPPRDAKQPMFSARILTLSLVQGLMALLMVLLVYGLSLKLGYPETTVRSLTFTTLVVTNVALIFANRSWTQSTWSSLKRANRAVWGVSVSALLLLFLVLYVPFLQGLFQLTRPPLLGLGLAILAGVVSVVWFEPMKMSQKLLS